MSLVVWSSVSVVFFVLAGSSRPPKYVWPLGNSTVYKEVLLGRDAHLPRNSQCFEFSDGCPGLPYKALTLSGEDGSYVDFYLDGKLDFTDVALSFYILPIGEPKGTILNYLCETGNVIKLAVLEGMLFISFWDEYGVSVGATAVPELLASGTWSHLLVSRDFDTGRVKVYHNGRIVDDIDDDFPNKISLPIKGSLRLGSSQKEDDVKFKGRFACFQFYTTTPTDQEVVDSKEYCLPSHWKITPQITLETRQVDGVEKQCVTDYVVPREQGEPEQCDVLNMACLTSGLNWASVLQKHKWTTGKRDSAYFHLIGRDRVPAPGDDIVLGDVMVTDKTLCSRLCLRVEGCQAFSSVVKTTNATQCLLYRRVADPVDPKHGAVYFSKV